MDEYILPWGKRIEVTPYGKELLETCEPEQVGNVLAMLLVTGDAR